jgi:hypothetical protein
MSEPSNIRQTVWCLKNGELVIQWPSRIEDYEFEGVEELLTLTLRVMRRIAEKNREAESPPANRSEA